MLYDASHREDEFGGVGGGPLFRDSEIESDFEISETVFDGVWVRVGASRQLRSAAASDLSVGGRVISGAYPSTYVPRSWPGAPPRLHVIMRCRSGVGRPLAGSVVQPVLTVGGGVTGAQECCERSALGAGVVGSRDDLPSDVGVWVAEIDAAPAILVVDLSRL